MKMYNLEAEKILLGAILMNEKIAFENMGLVTFEYFYSSLHQKIFETILALREKNEPVELLTVIEHLRIGKELENAGGAAYISSLLDCVVSPEQAYSSALVVRKNYYLRKALNDLRKMAKEVQEGNLETAARILPEISPVVETIEKFKGRLLDFIGELEKPSKQIKSGFETFDHFTGGFYPGDLVILAGPDGSGKTTFAINILLNLNISPLLFFSLEMGDFEIFSRIFSNLAEVKSIRFRTREFTDEDWQKIIMTSQTVSSLDWYISRNEKTVSEIISVARQKKPKFIILDYLQLLKGELEEESRATNLAMIARQLKLLAHEIQSPIICISSLMKEAKDEKHELSLRDIKESGGISEAADMVVMLKKITDDKIKFSIVKHRHGPTGDIFMDFQPDFVKFK